MTAIEKTVGARTFWDGRPLSYRERQLVAATTPWIGRALQETGRPIFMLTLTCKQAQFSKTGGLVPLTLERLWDAVAVYFRRIDKLVYKNASRRFEKRTERFVVVEGGGTTGKQIHLHMLVVAPPAGYMEPLTFVSAVLKEWRSSPWGRRDVQEKHDVHWQQVHDVQGAVKYLLKTGLDAVDWRSTRL